MEITGIICEYNPLHLGHKKQLDFVRQANPDGGIVCLMSGNFVQRGMPAIVNKMVRAEAAVNCGADLVLELPVTYALSSAEGFAKGGVDILAPFCNKLCFGAETGDKNTLMELAKALLSEAFSVCLKAELEKGVSFPAARQKALEAMGLDASLLAQPNNILAVEYCKAILAGGYDLAPVVIHREGNYHDNTPDTENPSATAIRSLLDKGGDWKAYVPRETIPSLEHANVHHIRYAGRAMLSKLRTMTDVEFEALPYSSEGLWRKLMHSARKEATLEAVLEATKSKRYTRTRLDRMVLCAFLGITEKMLQSPAPYVRVLAFNDKGRNILKAARKCGLFPNIGENQEHSYQILEDRCGDLYGLFSQTPEAPGAEKDCRIIYKKNAEV